MTDYIGEKVRDLVLSDLPWISRAAGFSHGVRYAQGSALGGAGEAASLLDAPSHGPTGRWVMLCPAAT